MPTRLSQYFETADECQPLTLENRFFGDTIVTMPPPSSGGIAIAQILATYERLLEAAGRPSLDSTMGRHLLIEAMKPAFALRARYLADPAFAPVPVEALLDESLVEKMVAEIDKQYVDQVRDQQKKWEAPCPPAPGVPVGWAGFRPLLGSVIGLGSGP